MEHEIIVAGFGGQGVLLAGRVLCYAGMLEGREVTWMPSYGAEQRGGTANCHVVISEDPVGSPVVVKPTGLIIMNDPSLVRFQDCARSNSLLVLNSSLVKQECRRVDIKLLQVPADDVAAELGEPRVANMVALGAFIGATGVVKPETVEKALERALSELYHKTIPLNMKAIARGMAFAEKLH